MPTTIPAFWCPGGCQEDLAVLPSSDIALTPCGPMCIECAEEYEDDESA